MKYFLDMVYAVIYALSEKGGSSPAGARATAETVLAGIFCAPILSVLQIGRRLYTGEWPGNETTVFLGRVVSGRVFVAALAISLVLSPIWFRKRQASIEGSFQSLRVPDQLFARLGIAALPFLYMIVQYWLVDLSPPLALGAFAATGWGLEAALDRFGLRARWAESADK